MLTITPPAREKMLEAVKGNGKAIYGLRLTVRQEGPTAQPQYGLSLVDRETPGLNDLVVTVEDIKIYLDRQSSKLVEGLTIDYLSGEDGTGFSIKSPYQPPKPPARHAAEGSGPTGPDAEAIQKLLDEQINPGVASHGGHVSLAGIKENIVYVRMSGGCQGCASSTATLKEGIVKIIKKELPHIKDVLDATDHAAGTNPFYSPDT